MKVKALQVFSSPVFGNVATGKQIDVPEGYASHLAGHGLVEIVEDAVPVTPASEPEKAPANRTRKSSKSKGV